MPEAVDPALLRRLFNASLTGVRRALDIREGAEINEIALKNLFQEAAAINAAVIRR